MTTDFTPNSNLYKAKQTDELLTTIAELGNNAQKIDDKFIGVDSQLADIVTINTSVVSEINAIIASSITKNTKVKFKKKVYEIDSPILIPDDVYIDFNRAVIKRKTGSGVFDLVKNIDAVNGNTGITLKDLRLDGNKDIDSLVATNDAHRFSGLKLTKVSDSELRNVTVTNTVNGEDQQVTPANGIFLVDCNDIDAFNLNGYNNDRTAIFFKDSDKIRVFGSKTYDNGGSGISSNNANECEYYGIRSYNNGYSNLSVNGLNCIVDGVRVSGSLYSGMNIGHNGFPSDGTIVSNVISYGNTLDGVTIGGSSHVQLMNINTWGNARENIRVFDGSSDSQMLNILSHDGVTGVRYYSGKNHTIDNAQFYKNTNAGIYADTGTSGVIGEKIKSYNNGYGAVLSNAINWVVGGEYYDDQATKTQIYGLWIAGGSGHIIKSPNTHDNLTSDYFTSANPANITRTFIPTEKVNVTTGINGWTLTNVSYYRDSFGVVHVEGLAASGSVGTACFVLPVGFRPAIGMIKPTVANNAFAYATVGANGNVLLSVSNVSHYLDAISFKAVI